MGGRESCTGALSLFIRPVAYLHPGKVEVDQGFWRGVLDPHPSLVLPHPLRPLSLFGVVRSITQPPLCLPPAAGASSPRPPRGRCNFSFDPLFLASLCLSGLDGGAR